MLQQKIYRSCQCLLAVLLFTEFGQVVDGSFKDSLGQVLGMGKSDGSDSDSVHHLSRRQVPMARFGRSSPDDSLHLLNRRQVTMSRIGRSMSADDPADDLLFAIAAILDTPRDDHRRQPPLPRYGRDSTSAVRDLLDLLTSESGGASEDVLSSLENRPSYFPRPAPRGGRLKRSLPMDNLQQYLTEEGFQRGYRAIPFARIGRRTDWPQLAKDKKAVPFARIGRSKSLSEPSSKNKSGRK